MSAARQTDTGTAAAAAQVRALREELYDAGFRPVAISNPGINHSSAGKAPLVNEWEIGARRDPPDALHDTSKRTLNTGILCDGLRALDIDVDDVALVQRIRATAIMAWGEAPMRVRDNSPRCLLLYRAAEGHPPKRQLAGKHGKVELLGFGQQFVAYGRHPSGAELRWMPDPPHAIAREHLPSVTEDQITQFFAAIAPLLEAGGEKTGGSAVKPTDPADLRILLDAMGDLGAGGFTEPAHLPPDAEERLRAAFENSRRARDRWTGLCDDLIQRGRDHSRTGMDMSLAALLKHAGAAPLDVALALLAFPHGSAGDRKKHPSDALRLRYVAKTTLRAGHPPAPASDPLDAFDEVSDEMDAETFDHPASPNGAAPEPPPEPANDREPDAATLDEAAWAEIPQHTRPQIFIKGGNIVGEVNAAEAALIADDSGIYQRGTVLARTGIVSIEISDDRETTGLRVLPVEEHALLEAMTRAARWMKMDGRSKEWREVNAPELAVKVYRARAGKWKLPVLVGIVSAPTLRRDGSLLDQPGYDLATGLLFDPCGQAFPAIPERPTKDDARAALGVLKHLVRDFPFGGKPNNPEPCADRSVTLSGILTAAVRRSLRTAPLHGFTAPAAGTGKSKLADIASVIVTGREAGVIAQSNKPEEFEKRLGSMFLASEPVVAIDNCDHPLGGEFLCQALTQPHIRVRILGESKMPEVLANSLVTATGNNLTLTGDMNRRALLCTLDAKVERPEMREFDADPVEVAKRDRPQLVVAALTVLRAYHRAGRPEPSTPLGGFTEWSRTVRDALVWLGEADPVATMEANRQNDPVLEALSDVMTEWNRAFGADPTLVKDAVARANETVTATATDTTPGGASETGSGSRFGRQVPANPGLRDAFLAVAGRGGAINNRALGEWLSKHRNRVVGNQRFTPGGETGGSAKWTLTTMATTSKPGSA